MKKLCAFMFVTTIAIANNDIDDYLRKAASKYRQMKDAIPENVRKAIADQKTPFAREIFDNSLEAFQSTTSKELEKEGLLLVAKKMLMQSSPEARNWCIECQTAQILLVKRAMNAYKKGQEPATLFEEMSPDLTQYILHCVIPGEEIVRHYIATIAALSQKDCDDFREKANIVGLQSLYSAVSACLKVAEL